MVCPGSLPISPFGVRWSKRTSRGDGLGPQAWRDEIEHGCDLLARHVELFDHFIDAEIFDVS
jgi:hypothetical protein